MLLQNLSIGRRMAAILVLILALSVVSSFCGILQLRRANADTERMLSDNVQTERQLADWLRINSTNMQRSIAIARSSDPSLAVYFAPASAESTRLTSDLQNRISERMDTPEEIALDNTLRDARKVYMTARDGVAQRKKSGDSAGATQPFNDEPEPKAAAYLAAVQAAKSRA